MLEAGFPVDLVKGVRVVAVPEEIDITNAAWLRLALLEAAADTCPTLVVDMMRTRFCDSAGLDVLVDAHKRVRAEGGEVLLALSGAAVLRILSITGIDQVIPVFTSLDEALARAMATVHGRGSQRADGAAGHGEQTWIDDADTALAESPDEPR
jgi:anti-sigma B factor antagonist